MNITKEITEAYEKYMNEVVDYSFNGKPIRRNQMGYASALSLVCFAAGYIEGVEATKQKPTSNVGYPSEFPSSWGPG